ncbi:MAG: PKD domain-containing protein [Desulfobacula sp.]
MLYQYDDLHRLTRVERSNGAITIYNYDELGNRTSKIVTSNTTLTAHFTGSPTGGQAPLNVSFTDQSVGNITSWLWNFGDGNTSTEQNPVHTYGSPGLYTVSLTVGNNVSETNTKVWTDFINVGNPVLLGPEISVDPKSQSVSGNIETITFNVSNTGMPDSDMNWTATENESWLSITSGASGLNSGTVTVVTTKNTGPQRTGTITITSPGVYNSPMTVQVVQAASDGPAVSIQKPVAGDVLMLGGTSNIQWTATSPHGITRVELYYHYNGNNYNIAILNTNPGTYSWTIPSWPSYMCADAAIRVRAFDGNGAYTDVYSPSFSVQDSAAPPAPWNMPEKLTTKTAQEMYISKSNSMGAIAVDSLGNVHLVYRYVQDEYFPGQPMVERQKIYYQKKMNGSWLAREEIFSLDVTSPDNNSSGYGFSDFNIAVDSENHPHISWVYGGPRTNNPDRTGYNGYEIYYLAFNGSSWETAVNVSNNSTYSKYLDIAIDSNNNIHFVWRDGITYTVTGTYSGTSALYHRIRYADGSWSTTIPVVSPDSFGTFPALAKGQNGEMHLVYNTTAALEHTLWNGSSWSAPSIIFNDGTQYNYKDIAIDNDNRVHLIYEVYGNFGDGDVNQIRYTLFDGSVWSPAEIVSNGNNNGYEKIPEVTLSSKGWPQIVWYEDSSTGGHIYYKQKTSLGWSNTSQLNTTATRASNSDFNSVSTGTSNDDILHVVWPAYFDGGDEIYYTYAGIATETPVPPVASFTASPVTGYFPLSVNFTDTSTGNITAREWDFNNDGVVDSTEQNPSHIFYNPGTYTVGLKVTGPGGSDTKTQTDYIKVMEIEKAVYDHFEGSSINSELWNINNSGGVLAQADGFLTSNGPPNSIFSDIITKQTFYGDFEFILSYSDFYSTAFLENNNTIPFPGIFLSARKASFPGDHIFIKRDRNHSMPLGTGHEFISMKWQGWNPVSDIFTGASTTSGLMRIQRVGSTITTSFNEGSGWVIFGNYPNSFTDDVEIQIGVETGINGIFHVKSDGLYYTGNSSITDSDGDGLPNKIEGMGCTNPLDADTDDDGISDGNEDTNKNGAVDIGETSPCNRDTDGDGIQDGTEKGVTAPVADPDGAGPSLGTNVAVFQPDLDPGTRTNPLKIDSDNDGIADGAEDTNFNGRIDSGETDPAPVQNRPAIDLDGYGAVSYHTDTYSGIDLWIKIIDHDGIADNGSSHAVTVDVGSTTYPMSYKYKANAYSAYYAAYISSPAVSGDYVFTVADSEGNTVSLTDAVVVNHLTPPANLSCVVSGTTPTFTWTGDTNASYFRVRIYNLDGSSRWYGNVKTSPYTVPPGVLSSGTSYKYSIEARDGHSGGYEPDNVSKSPASSNDNPVFTTGSVTQAPMISRNDSGAYTWMSSTPGTDVELAIDIRIYDAQGVPGNIKSVKAILPGGEELPLFFNNNEGSNCGLYQASKWGTFVSGNYTIRVEDMDGNTDLFTEHVDVNPLTPVSSLVYSKTGSGIDFSWDPVPGAVVYRLEIRDVNYSVLSGYSGTQTSCHVSEGYFKKNSPYRYRVVAYKEFIEDNLSNATGSAGRSFMPVFTPYPDPGASAPEIDLNMTGVFVIHRHAPNTNTSNYLLYFELQVSDADGVPGNIAKVEVTYPDGVTKKELIFESSISTTKGSYSSYAIFKNSGTIPAGEYTFRAFDLDGKVSAVIPDILTVNPIPIPENLSPLNGASVFSTSPVITWDPVPGASFYRVRIYKGYDQRIFSSSRLPVNSFTVPPGTLQQGIEYSYRVDAYRGEDGSSISNMSSSKTSAGERPRFNIKDANSGITGRILDPGGFPLSGAKVTVLGMDHQPCGETFTQADGSFSFGLNDEGEYHLRINEGMDFGLPAWFVASLRISPNQILDVGEIQLPQGAVVTGTMLDFDGNPVQGIFEYMGGNFINVGSFQTDSDGQFSIILPKGAFIISTSDDDNPSYYDLMHNFVTVKADSVFIEMGNLVVCPSSQIVLIQGTATGPQRYDGDMFVAAFPDGFVLKVSTESMAEPLSFFPKVDPGNPVYALPVPPEIDYCLLNGYLNRSSSGKESITIVNRTTVSVGATSLSGVDFTITDRGYFVLGGVSGNGNINATIGLYDISGTSPVMTGLTYSDLKGRFEFFSVPAGDYKIGAFVPGTGNEFFSENFTVVNSAVTLSTINLVNDGFGADMDRDKDLDGANLDDFLNDFKPGAPVVNHPMDLNSDGFVDGEDLKAFALNFGKSDN